MFIVNTCWVYVTDSDGVSTLKNVEFSELEKIKAENRAAPKDKRRYFIEDYCVNGSVCDCLHLEVTREQYNLWQREYRANAGALNAESDAGVTLVSLNACADGDSRREFQDAALPPVTNQEERCVLRMDLERLWNGLNDSGKSYLCDMLAYYQEKGGVWGSGVHISQKYGVTRRMVSEYHAELKKIAEKALGDSV